MILDRDTYLEVLHGVSFGDLHYHVDLVHMNDSGHIVVVQCKLSHDAYGDSASRSKAKTASMSAKDIVPHHRYRRELQHTPVMIEEFVLLRRIFQSGYRS